MSGGSTRIEHMFESSETLMAAERSDDHVAGDETPLWGDEAPWWVDELSSDEPWSDADILADAAAGQVGAGLLMDLLQVDPGALTADEAVTYAQQVDRFAAFAAGLQVRARAVVRDRLVAHGVAEDSERARCLAELNARRTEAGLRPRREGSGFVTPEMRASAEMAAALRVATQSIESQLRYASDLVGPMAPLGDALLAGHLSAAHAAAIARELSRLPLAGDSSRVDEFAQQCARILAIVVPYAASHTPGQSARRTRGLVLTTDPVSAKDRRRETAEREHGVWLSSREEGTCEITAVLPVGHGHALMDAITALARNPLFETSEGCVTAGQRRVAALMTLALGDPGSDHRAEGPVAEAKLNAGVSVVVPLSVLTSGEGAGLGGTVAGEAVSADVILDLLAEVDASSTLRRLVVDSSGCIVDAGRTRYSISDTQRHLIVLRDGTCRFPGCSRAARRCEIDHATAYECGGCTDLDNLGPLCKHHHQLKTHGGWTITRSERSGACTWRSPLGRVYEHRPPDLIPLPLGPPAAVDDPLPF